MKTMKDLVRRHAVPIYFALTFAISWGAVLAVVGPHGIPIAADQAVVLGMAVLLGPSAAGILLTGLASGRVGYRELVSRMLRWRVGARWYAVALLTAPLSTAVALLALSLFSSDFVPSIVTSDDKVMSLVMGVVAGIMVGFFEELGWTGFAIPRLRLRSSVLTTGLVVGLLWGAWHFILFWESDSFSGVLPLALLLVRLFSWLPAYRVLMVWVHDRTESLLVVMLLHVSLVATLLTMDPSLAGGSLLIFILARAAVLWMLAGAVTMAADGRLAKQQPQRRGA